MPLNRPRKPRQIPLEVPSSPNVAETEIYAVVMVLTITLLTTVTVPSTVRFRVLIRNLIVPLLSLQFPKHVKCTLKHVSRPYMMTQKTVFNGELLPDNFNVTFRTMGTSALIISELLTLVTGFTNLVWSLPTALLLIFLVPPVCVLLSLVATLMTKEFNRGLAPKKVAQARTVPLRLLPPLHNLLMTGNTEAKQLKARTRLREKYARPLQN